MPGWLVAIIVAVATAGPGYLAYRASTRVKKIEIDQAGVAKDNEAREKSERERTAMFESANRVMNETIERMQQVHNSIVDGLRQEIDRLNAQIARLEAREEADMEKLRDYEAMKRTAARMEQLVEQLAQRLGEPASGNTD